MNNEFENNNNIPENERVNEISQEPVYESTSIADESPEEGVNPANDYSSEEAETVYEGAPVYEDDAESFDGERVYAYYGEAMEEGPVKKKKSGRLALKIILLVVASAVFFGGIYVAFRLLIAPRLFSMEKPGKSDVKINTTEYDLTKSETVAPKSEIAKIAQLRMPSVVAITNRSVSDVITFFGTYSQESTSSGSGIIIGQNDKELLIVTNYHVVANAEELSVVFSAVESELEAQSENDRKNVFDNDRIPSATLKGYDAEKDLAVIAVYLDDIPEDVVDKIEIAPIGDSSKMLPGDQVIAIGNSLGYGQSVTTGIISAMNRKITMKSADGYSTVTNSFIQTDAAINQGNSGGALLDMAGNVIGINSVKIATTGVEGMGYAIPISDVESIIKDLMTQRTRKIVDKDEQGFLGIVGSDVQERDTEMYGIPAGVYINEVTEGLAAEAAGLKKGHVIVEFEGHSITTMTQLQERLRYYSEGEAVTVKAKVPENGEYVEKSFSVILSNRSENITEEE